MEANEQNTKEESKSTHSVKEKTNTIANLIGGIIVLGMLGFSLLAFF